MTQPPTLSYAPPPPPPRGLTAAFALLLLLGSLYACATLYFALDVAADFSQPRFFCFLIPITAPSATIFIAAAIRIRRHTRRWAILAFITTLANLAALLSCLGYAVLVKGNAQHFPFLTIGCCLYALPFALLTILAQLLFTLLRNLKQSP